MAGIGVTEKVALMHDRFLEKRTAVAQRLALFKALRLEDDPTLRNLLARLRMEWREKHAGSPAAPH